MSDDFDNELDEIMADTVAKPEAIPTGTPAAAALIRLLRDHHAEPDRIAGSKFLALRFQTLNGLGLSAGLALGPLLS